MFDRLFRRSASVPALCVNQPPDDSAERLHDAERRIAQLEALLEQRVIELEQYRTLATTKVPKVSRKPAIAKEPKSAKPAKLSALAFWRMHGEAVDKIRAEFGDDWKISAPFGKTELVTLASSLKSYKTERGTKLSWSPDQRFPAAEYWPNGAFPEGVTANGDYDRCVGKYIAAKDAHGHYSQMVIAPPEATRDSAWHEAHGYVWHVPSGSEKRDGYWIAEILLRSQLAHEEGIELEREANRLAALERACLTYGPQPLASEPFADVEDDLAEAAD